MDGEVERMVGEVVAFSKSDHRDTSELAVLDKDYRFLSQVRGGIDSQRDSIPGYAGCVLRKIIGRALLDMYELKIWFSRGPGQHA